MSIVRKITAKTVAGKIDKKAVINSEGEPLFLMTVFGRVTRSVPGETDYGPYLKFKGSFEAVNIANGEVFKSMNLILPPIGEEIIEEGLAGEGVKSLDFALKVGVRRDDDSIAGYQWVAESVRQTETGDPLAQLRAELADNGLLPAPTSEAEPEPEPEPKTTKKKTAARR